MGVDDAVWAKVRCAHETSREPAAQLCRRFGVAPSTYYKRRKRENWGARPTPTSSTPNGNQSRQQVADESGDRGEIGLLGALCPTQARKFTSRAKLIDRLYAAIDKELQQLETGAPSVAELERRTRTLTSMIRGFEKVLELDADKQKTKRGQSKRKAAQGCRDPDTSTSDEAEFMRQQIAERLERLHAQRANRRGSQKT